MGHPVRINGSDVAAALVARSREPFTKELARVLGVAPSPAALRRFADKHPDRWAQMVGTMARLAGYTDKTETVSLSVYADLKQMSDMELEATLSALTARLGVPSGQLTEGDAPQSEGACAPQTGSSGSF